MKSPDYYARRCRESRRDGIALLAIFAACLLAFLAIGGPLKAPFEWVPLALAAMGLTAAAGAVNELADARRLHRLAQMEETFQPLERL